MQSTYNSSSDNKNVAFLFDLDGVLIDSETEYTRMWTAIDERFRSGFPDLARRIKGMTLDNIISSYFPTADRDELIGMLYDMESRMSYSWLPGAKEMLEWLDREGIPAVLVTSSNEDKMRHLREELPELVSYFAHIVTADMISRSKPDPEGYLLGARLAGADPRRCVVFEDSLQGVKAGEAAGAYVVGVAGTLPAGTIAPHSDIVTDSLATLNPADIVAVLEKRS